MKKRIPAARLELVADRNGDIVYEPRRVPLLKDTLGISQRAELARQAMAAPINHSPRLQPPVLADCWKFLITVGLAVCAWSVLLGIGMLIWALV